MMHGGWKVLHDSSSGFSLIRSEILRILHTDDTSFSGGRNRTTYMVDDATLAPAILLVRIPSPDRGMYPVPLVNVEENM